MENTNYLIHQSDSFDGSITERRSTSDYQLQNYPVQQPNLIKRQPRKQFGVQGRETDGRRGSARDSYGGRVGNAVYKAFPPAKVDAEIDNIMKLIKLSTKTI
jgi:hypothetical protein